MNTNLDETENKDIEITDLLEKLSEYIELSEKLRNDNKILIEENEKLKEELSEIQKDSLELIDTVMTEERIK